MTRLPDCQHWHAVPVKLLLTGELVAWLCELCSAQLPASWEPIRFMVMAELEIMHDPGVRIAGGELMIPGRSWVRAESAWGWERA